ncbi:DUF2231 domain-containing protein [Tianweitania sp. BSSL-BM11]|uniref:DUF2231 domain-containing protein n=1 Tax=Tianweitania aestuarii TaxID=2814886 RepID=A0ABS5RQR2_9HYPH|nr:DUF2231 domain-containing protein [Tianweitania aestuarii]MBS9719385.1 DUF2231 domain-containing protein [Tianweitania aestuarii]
MDTTHPTAVALAVERPFYTAFSQFPAVCFTLTLLTDIAYYLSANLLWQNFSSWLLFAGLVFGGFALVVAIIEFLARSGLALLRPTWPVIVGYLVVLLLALLNSFIHAGDGWTAVVPYGLATSAVTFVVMLVVAGMNRSMKTRRLVGVNHHA